MSLVIDLSPAEEARLAAAASEIGLAPAELVKKLVDAHFPAGQNTAEAAIENQLGKSQDEEHLQSAPDVITEALFAQWAEEDARMTQAERAENDRIYAEIEKNGIPRVQI